MSYKRTIFGEALHLVLGLGAFYNPIGESYRTDIYISVKILHDH